jgi:hypothetical protein
MVKTLSILPGVVLVATAFTPTLADDEAEANADKKLAFHAFVDLYYAFNSSHPANGLNFVPGAGTTAQRANEFSVNLAEVEVSMPAEPVGFRISVGAGTGEDVVHAAEPGGNDVWRHVLLASATYETHVGRGLAFEAGIMPCHVGMEAFASKDNWNYTRSWLAELSPYYQTGIKISYPFTDRWSGQFHVVNGWQIIGENNSAKTFGTQVAYASDKLSASLNTLAGPELPGNDDDWRVFGDFVLTVRPTPAWSVGANVDVARESRPAGPSASWWGAAAYVRIAPEGSRYAFTFRAERFDDPDGAISGTAQELTEGTLTFEYRPSKHLILKVEGRYDRSSDPVFSTDALDAGAQPVFSPSETLIVVGVVATF